MVRLIGICGEGPKSGKTTAGLLLKKLLKKHYNDDTWEIKRFAHAPKKILSELTGVSVEALNTQMVKDQVIPGWAKHGLPITFREGLIKLSESLKEIDPHIWIRGLFANWYSEEKWIIDDVRFANEAGKIILEGGIIIKICREEAEKGKDRVLNDHVKYSIDNNGSIEELENALLNILNIYDRR